MATYPDNRHATSTPITAVQYVGAGNNLIYSDNPEYVSSGALTYHYGFILPANTPRDVEIYMNVSNGKNGAPRAGVAIKNMGSTTATVTVKGTREYFVRGSGARNSEDCAKLLLTALNASTRKYTLAAGQGMFLDDKTFTFNAGEESRLAYGRYTISADKANVNVRTFSGNANHTLAQLFSMSTMAPASNNKQFCGIMGYNTKKLKTPFPCKVGTAFLVGEWWQSNSSTLYNTGEYTPATAKPGANPVNAGNFGVVYDLDFTDCLGKNVKFIPDQNTGEGCILRSVNGGKYEPTPFLSSSQIKNSGCWTAKIDGSNTANVKLIIPGANAGNIKAEIY